MEKLQHWSEVNHLNRKISTSVDKNKIEKDFECVTLTTLEYNKKVIESGDRKIESNTCSSNYIVLTMDYELWTMNYGRFLFSTICFSLYSY